MRYLLLLLILLSGCLSNSSGYRFKTILIKENSAALCLGHIYVGMPMKELAKMFGGQNIVSFDKKQRKNLVFTVQNKKISYTKFTIASHIVPSLLLEADAAEEKNTIVVKLDENNTVRDFNYF